MSRTTVNLLMAAGIALIVMVVLILVLVAFAAWPLPTTLVIVFAGITAMVYTCISDIF